MIFISCFVVVSVPTYRYLCYLYKIINHVYNNDMIKCIGLSGSTQQSITLYHTNNYEWYQDDFLKCLFG